MNFIYLNKPQNTIVVKSKKLLWAPILQSYLTPLVGPIQTRWHMNEEYKTMQRDELERPVDKHIYIKNRLVLEELKAAENASKYSEKAILYYREQMKSE